MKPEQILEGNTLIAKFMGKITGVGIPLDLYNKYHTSWDWLMPVVEKIETLGTIVEITLCLGKMCRIVKGSFKHPVVTIANVETNDTIESVWLAVIKYTKWHNSQTTKQANND